MQRPSGYYWVRWTGGDNNEWVVAELRGDDGIDDDGEPTIVQYWYAIGTEYFYTPERFESDHEIGDQIIREAK